MWRGTILLCLLAMSLTFFTKINALASDAVPPTPGQAADAQDSENPYELRRNAVRAQLRGDPSDSAPIPNSHDNAADTSLTTPPILVQPAKPAAIQAQLPAVTPQVASPVAPPAQAANASPGISTYTSPGIIVKKEVINLTPNASMPKVLAPDQLAALMPAAGGDETTPPATPLIPLPDQANAPLIQPPGATPPPPPTATAIVPAPIPVTVAPAENTKPGASLEDIVQKTPDGNAAAAAGLSAKALVPAPGSTAAPAPVAALVPAPASTPAPAATLVPAPTSAATAPVAATPEATAVAATEPPHSLSKQSEAIVKKIPANLDKPKKQEKKLPDVTHAKDTDYLKNQAQLQDQDNKHSSEAMGIKIEVKTPPAYVNHQLELAYEALINGQTEDAIIIYRGVLENDPDNKNALFGLATTYHRAGQIDLARPLYGKLLALDPNNRDALNNFLVLLADESPEDALAQLQKLENKNPDFSPIPAQMAVIYQKLGNSDKASEKMFRAVSLAPENLTYRYNLAIMLDKQHNYEEAAKLYRQIVEAHQRGDTTPGDISKIQERLTFISSNRS